MHYIIGAVTGLIIIGGIVYGLKKKGDISIVVKKGDRDPPDTTK